MIVELIGPGGVGKTTVEPLVAERLGIAYYPGRKRQGFHGEAHTGWRLWSARLWSVLSNPRLLIAAVRAHQGPVKERAWFTMDLCRRERAAARAKRLGSGVVASGPVHALCMMSGSTDLDVSSLLSHLTKADVYVYLQAEPAEATRRLAGRLAQAADDLGHHEEWMARYSAAATRIFTSLDRPLIGVRADGGPEEVADEITRLLKPYLD